jgi:chromosome segregation ATPase
VTHGNGHVEPLAEQLDEQRATNGTRSESLTRLQDGYLKVISALEDHNESLQQDVNIAQAYAVNRAQRAAYFEQQNRYLQLELEAARANPDVSKSNLVQLETTLTAKNTRLKEKNTQIMHLEQANRDLKEELKAEKMKNRTGLISKETEPTMVQTEPRRMPPAMAQTGRDKRGVGAEGWGKKQKKRKLIEFVREGAYDKYARYDRVEQEGEDAEVVGGGKEDPWVID